MAAVTQDRPTRFGLVTGLTFVGALVVALVVRGSAVVGIAALFLLFVPLEKLFALRPQKVFRRGLLTDLTHLLVNNLFSTALGIVLVVVALIPVFWGAQPEHRRVRPAGGSRRAPQHRDDGLGGRRSAPPLR